MSSPKYAAVEVTAADLAASKTEVMSVVTQKMWVAGVPAAEIQTYCEELDAGADPVAVTAAWVTVR